MRPFLFTALMKQHEDIQTSLGTETSMATLTLNPEIYKEAQAYATAENISVEEWVTSLIIRFIPSPSKGYRMKNRNELSPELLKYVGFAKPKHYDGDLNGDKAREDYLTAKYTQQ